MSRPPRDFSEHDIQVLTLICIGKTDKEIARIMQFDLDKVYVHTQWIRRRLETRNRAQTAVKAILLGIVSVTIDDLN
jgi:DNA-binding CsgD family transcriptional regulator